jgi:GH24 family phage-related lysozyme (muramidase)
MKPTLTSLALVCLLAIICTMHGAYAARALKKDKQKNPDTLDLAVEIVKQHEGFSPVWYNDRLDRAIGYGFTSGRLADMYISIGDNMSEAEACKILRRLLAVDYIYLRSNIEGFSSLPPESKAALVSMCYNSRALIGPKLTFYLEKKNYRKATEEIALGHNPRGKYGLVVRRFKEAELFRSSFKFPAPTLPETLTQFYKVKEAWKQ